MKQQINLHQPIFRKQRALFSAQIVLRVCFIWILALALIYALSLWREGALSREKARLEHDRDIANGRLQELFLRQTDPEQSAELEAKLKQFQSERLQKESVVRVLARGDLGVTTGFAAQIDALAARRISGLWLTRVRLDGGGQYVSLQGRALGEDLIPEYLERLAGRVSDPRFPGGRFGEISLQRESGDEAVSFELRSKPGGLSK